MPAAFLSATSALMPGIGYADKLTEAIPMMEVFGDLRFRLEEDWDSKQSDGTARDDRGRARLRARIGVKIRPTDSLEFTTRLRTGSRASQQSPHITLHDFNDNDTGDKDLVFDKWYMRLQGTHAWVWGGRNSLPFWKQNELLWDDDATVAGAAVGYNYPLGQGGLSGNLAYLLLPDGMDRFNGDMWLAQLSIRPVSAVST